MSLLAKPVASGAPARPQRRAEGPRGLRSAMSSRLYLPAFSIVVVAGALVAIGWASGWGGFDFAGSMASLRVIVVGPITLAILGALLIVERVRPAQRRPLFARGYRQDVLFAVLNATLTVPLVTALTLSFSEVVRSTLPWLVLAEYRRLAALGRHRRDLRGHGRVQLVRPSGQPPQTGCSGASTSCTTPKRT